MIAERGDGAGATTQHGDEDPWCRRLQSFQVADQLVDPGRHLQAEGRRHGVLPVGPAGQRHVLGPLRQIRHGGQGRADLR